MNKMKDKRALTTTCAYNGDAKRAFHRVARRYLRLLAEFMGLDPRDYDLRSNRGGIAVSGEVILHAEHLYVQVSQSCMGPRALVLYRSCDSRHDYCGHQNHFADADELMDTHDLARRCMALVDSAVVS